jgi:lipopolysaccharide transport system permease protein
MGSRASVSAASAQPRVRSAHGATFGQYLDPVAFSKRLWSQRDLIRQFTRREIEGRYRSSMLGLGWSFINPLVLLGVYTFVFGVVFKQRWGGLGSDGLAEFGLVLFAGLIAFGIFSECVGRAPGLIVSTPNYVKRVVFPLEVLPVSVLGSALFHAAISLTVLLGMHLVLGGAVHWTWLLIPVVLLPIILISLGLLWVLASLGVFLRDLAYTVTLVVQVLFFVTPIFYPLELVPASLRTLVSYNPLASGVQSLRAVIFAGALTGWPALLVSGVIGLATMFLGYAWFMRTRGAFGDVI